jgi:small subunit ribosomal protein S2
MGGLPDILFIIDTNKESIAVKEASKLGIPTAAVIDSNSDPDGVTFPIPGNDDALRAIDLYCELASQAVLAGIEAEMMASSGDMGEMEEPVPESVPAEGEATAEPAAEPAASGPEQSEEAATTA